TRPGPRQSRSCCSRSRSPSCSSSAASAAWPRGTSVSSAAGRLTLRGVALFYLLAILVGPVVVVCWRTFDQGAEHVWDTMTNDATTPGFECTLPVTAIAVPVNPVFGIVVGLAIVRRDFPLKGLLNAFIDLPLALSPVVVGLSLFLLYGRGGWFGDWF